MNPIIAFVVLSFLGSAAAAAGDWHEHHRIIVTTSWVHERLKDPRLVLLHVGDPKEYDSLHLPGAQFLPVRDIAKPFVEGSLSLELPETGRLDSVLEARGISDSSIVVLYPGKDWFTPTARVYLTLDYFGLGDRAFLMDGGMPAWISEGKPVTATLPEITPGKVTPQPRNDVVVTKNWVRERLEDPKVVLLDARNPQFYTGQDTGNASQPGHLPGAKNLPFDSLIDSTGHYKTPDQLRALFAGRGMDTNKTAVSYCHVGQQACLVYVMARFLGYEARMYDGSMQEWTRDPEMPVVKEPAAGK